MTCYGPRGFWFIVVGYLVSVAHVFLAPPLGMGEAKVAH